MTTFDTHIAGIPCQCEVQFYSPYIPARIYGTGLGDAEPPEYGDFVYRILDRKGYVAEWLEKKASLDDEIRLLNEYLALQNDHKFIDQYERAYC